MEPEGDSLWIKVKTSPEILKYIVPKGFIALDGISLTIVKVFDGEICFNFMLVAYSQQKVVIPNLEVDTLGKHVERLPSSSSFGGFIASFLFLSLLVFFPEVLVDLVKMFVWLEATVNLSPMLNINKEFLILLSGHLLVNVDHLFVFLT
ncbi:Lumazine-binding domain [Dillenia turbinata]|uniref:Lumazine-binding domain n=1 Tax=Dillenia turbinata TaxID=194707 RepID=A0AAN8Z9L7_9MAGN